MGEAKTSYERDYRELCAKHEELKAAYDKVCAECASLELKCGDLSEVLDNFKMKHAVLKGQMEVVRMFLGKGDSDE